PATTARTPGPGRTRRCSLTTAPASAPGSALTSGESAASWVAPTPHCDHQGRGVASRGGAGEAGGVSEPGDERAGEPGGPDGPDGLGRLNGLPAGDARRELLACCAAPGWAAQLAAGRPYGSVDALVARSDAVVAGMTVDDLRAALDGHPRIGDRPATPPAPASGPPPGPDHQAGPTDRGWSRGEQAGVAGSGDEVRRGLA